MIELKNGAMPRPLDMTRWIDARTSDARIGRDAGAPNLIPPRRWNRYVSPSGETDGIAEARSGTGFPPSGAGTSGNASSPRYSARTKNHADGRLAREGSSESTSSSSSTRKVPPLIGVTPGDGDRNGAFDGHAVNVRRIAVRAKIRR